MIFLTAFILLFSMAHAVEGQCASTEEVQQMKNAIIIEVDGIRSDFNVKYEEALIQLNTSKAEMTEQINSEVNRKVQDIALILVGSFVASLSAFMFVMSFMLLRRNDIFEERLDRELYADLKDIREIRTNATDKHRVPDEVKKPDNPSELAKKE